MIKVIVTSLLNDRFINELRTDFPDVAFVEATTDEDQKHHIRDADVFMGSLSRELFLAAERLRWVHCPVSGINSFLSIPEFIESDVVLTNARASHANPMADHVFWMILTFAHCGHATWEDQQAHRWNPPKYDGQIMELSGRTLGILALGDIGKAVARRAHGFGMEVYAVGRRSIPAPPKVKEVWGQERLDELLKIADWFVITAPLTSETKGLIDRRRIGLMKPSAHIIVVSRGGIVDEEALADALRTKQIAGVGLDAMASEPPPADSPLWDMDNVILTPHASALTPEMWEGRRGIFKENLRRFLANEPFLYVCDKRAGY